MNTNLLRSFAVVIGVSVCVVAQAQTSSYQSPANWSKFNPNHVTFRTVATPFQSDAVAEAAEGAVETAQSKVQQLPIPAFVPAEKPLTRTGENGPEPLPYEPSASDCKSCQSPYKRAIQGISPWFAGTDLLFLTLANDTASRRLVVGDGTGVPYLHSSDVDPSGSTGFDAHIGRYFDCGRYALDVSYFLFNPDNESLTVVAPLAGDFYAAMPAWRDISVDPGTGVDTVYNHFDGAAAYRVQRDMFFQGMEANWVGFGLMGARRMGTCGPRGILGGGALGYGSFGGAGGPLARSRCGRVQIQNSQGFRWFQLEDQFEFAANINGAAGYQADDLYYNVDVENNLFGYQIGSRINYCLARRMNLGIGGKIGIYGNHASARQRVGTETTLAYRNGVATDLISTEDSDTFVAALGELDLGLGYRVSHAWTVTGGYRLISACGVATSTGSFADEYSSVASSGEVSADDCIILHGGYVGLEYNW